MSVNDPETAAGLPITQRPLISVCIANYNGMAVIDECLASILGQEGDLSVEIIVHDDASTDGSAAHIRESHPNVRLIESDENVGFCIANNRMVAIAKGDYILLLNNDASLFSDALGLLVSEAQRLGGTAILTLPQYDADTGELLDIGSRIDPFLNPVPNLDPRRSDVATVHGACLWVDKALWKELGGFPEWFGSLGEDLYLCCQARLAGYHVRALGISGYRHHVGRSFGGGKTKEGRLHTTFVRRALSERNKTFVMVMTYPAPFMQVLLAFHIVFLLIEGLSLSMLHKSLRYLDRIYLPVFTALIRERHTLIHARLAAMERRRLASTEFFAEFDWMPQKLRLLIRHGLPHVS